MSVFLSVFWHTEQQVHAYKSMTRAAGADACPQGRRLYILRDGCRSAAVPRLHRGGRAPPHLQVTGWAAAGHFLEEGEGEEKGLTSDWHGVLRFSRHAHRGELAGNLVRGGVQVLQLPQVQTAAADQPRSQVPRVCWLPVKKISYDFCFCFFYLFTSFLLGLCGAWVFLSLTWVSQAGNPVFRRQPCTSFLSRASGLLPAHQPYT